MRLTKMYENLECINVTQLWTTNEQTKSSIIASNSPVVRSTPENSDKRLASFNLIALLITNNVTYHNVSKLDSGKEPSSNELISNLLLWYLF